jgi:alkylation response protein AidB-like acyl-CoA dehydrogenase
MLDFKAFPAEREAKHDALLAAVESVRDVVEAGTDESERNCTLPLNVVTAMQDAGLFRLKLPAELGGAEADPVTQIDVIEAMTRVYPSAGWVLMTNATAIGSAGAFLPERGAGEVFAEGRVPRAATVGNPNSTLQPADGGFILNGRWSFVSGVPHSEYVDLGARLLQPDGEATPITRTCFVPTSLLTIHDNWHVVGLRGSGSNDVSAENVFVPEHMSWQRLDRVRGMRQRGGPIFLLGLPSFVSSEHAAFALGVARLSLDLINGTVKWKTRGRGAAALTLADRPAYQRFAGESELKLRAARALTVEVHEQAWQIACTGVTPDSHVEAELRASAVLCTDVAVEIATQAFRFAGGSALQLSNKLQMCLRDANAGAQHLAVSDVAYENLGQFILGLEKASAAY